MQECTMPRGPTRFRCARAMRAREAQQQTADGRQAGRRAPSRARAARAVRALSTCQAIASAAGDEGAGAAMIRASGRADCARPKKADRYGLPRLTPPSARRASRRDFAGI